MKKIKSKPCPKKKGKKKETRLTSPRDPSRGFWESCFQPRSINRFPFPKPTYLVRRVHNLVSPQLRAQPATSSPTSSHPHRSSDTLPRRLLKALLRHHINLIRQRHNNILVAAVLEIIRLDLLRIPLDGVRILPAREHLAHIPRDDERPRGGDDGGFFVVDAGVEARGGEGQRGFGLVLELGDVGGLQAEAAGLGFGVFGEGFFEAELAFVFAVFLEGVDEEEVGAAGGEDPAAVGGDVEPDDGLAEGGDVGFGVDAEAVEHADVAFVGGDGDVAFLGGGGHGEVVFGDVLFEFGVDELVAGYPGVDAVESIAGETEEGLLACHL